MTQAYLSASYCYALTCCYKTHTEHAKISKDLNWKPTLSLYSIWSSWQTECSPIKMFPRTACLDIIWDNENVSKHYKECFRWFYFHKFQSPISSYKISRMTLYAYYKLPSAQKAVLISVVCRVWDSLLHKATYWNVTKGFLLNRLREKINCFKCPRPPPFFLLLFFSLPLSLWCFKGNSYLL